MLQQNTTKRLGYWLLLLHLYFEDDMAVALAAQRLDRRGWQVLHALAIGVDSVDALDDAFRPFLTVDRLASCDSIVEDFVGRGWAVANRGRLALTDAGKAAHVEAEAIVNDQAEDILAGLTEDQFLAANGVLERIAANMRPS
ncbi:hypothetical protein [Nocardia sp. NPDC057227]|uniref:hypothetical protein n=1 Tax=Nocardia sp. NPDC057227 TaxID=3346056 RepID=UPI003642AB98